MAWKAPLPRRRSIEVLGPRTLCDSGHVMSPAGLIFSSINQGMVQLNFLAFVDIINILHVLRLF